MATPGNGPIRGETSPRAIPRCWEEEAPARGEAGDGHGRGTAELLACLWALLFTRMQEKPKNPAQTGDLKAEKVAVFATEFAIKKERAKPDPALRKPGSPQQGMGTAARERGSLFALNPSWGGEKKV